MSDIAFSVLVGNGFDDIIFKTIMLKGEKGNSVASVEKTSTSGLVDTYTIYLTDGTVGGTFTVTNGAPVNIDDTVTASDKTWSSSKLSGMIKSIDDSSVDADKLWSSQKIDSIVAQKKTIQNVAIASFSDGADNVPVSELIVSIDAVQAGSGTPSPDNVRAISGWSECNIHKSGINLWDEVWELGALQWANGQPTPASDRIRSKNYNPIKSNTQYYMKVDYTVTSGVPVIFYYDKDMTLISYSDATIRNTIIESPANAEYFKLCILQTTTYESGISLNYPATETNYFAFNGGTDTISLGQTVYGGSLNVSTGLLTITHGYVDLGSLAWYYDSPYLRFQSNGITGMKGLSDRDEIPNWMCSNYEAISISSFDSISKPDMSIRGTLNNTIIFVRDTNYTDAPTFKAAMSGVQLVYELATPITVQLTPTEVRSLLNCNIFADTGDVDELIYFKASSNDVAKLIEAYSSAENVAFDNDGTDLSSTDVQNGMVELSSKRFAYKNVESSTNVDDLKAQGVYYGNITNIPQLAQGGIVITTTKPVFTAVQVYPNVVMGTLYVGSQIAIGNSGAMFVRGSTYTPPITSTPPDASDRPASVTWKDWHQVAFWEDIFGESIDYTSESGTTIYEEIEALKTRLTALGG